MSLDERRLRQALELETRPPRNLAAPAFGLPQRAEHRLQAWLAGAVAVLLAAGAIGVVYSAANVRGQASRPAGPAPSGTAGRPSQPSPFAQQWWVSATDGWWIVGCGSPPGTCSGPYTTPLLLEHTTDGGEHWSADFNFACEVCRIPPSARNLAFLDRSHGFLVDSAELWATSDGTHWERRSVPPGIDGAYGLSFISESEGWGLFAVPDSAAGQVWHTADGGRSWSFEASLPVALPTDLDIAGIRFWDARRGYVVWTDIDAAQQHLLATRDGGATWREVQLHGGASIGGMGLGLPQFFSSSTGVFDYVAETGVQVWTTSDGGATWTGPRTLPFGTGARFGAADLTHWWVANELGVRRSIDGGRTWSQIVSLSGRPQLADLEFIDTQHGFAAPVGPFPGPLYATDDGGRTWRALAPYCGPPFPATTCAGSTST